jgi:signal transduction histidine kinase
VPRERFFDRDFRHIRPMAAHGYNCRMDTSARHRWTGLAGYVAWLTCGLPVVLQIFQPTENRFLDAVLDGTTTVAWASSYAAFGVFYTLFTRLDGPRWRHLKIGCLFVEVIAALAVASLVPSAFSGTLMVIVAAKLPEVLSLRWALAWVFGQSTAFGILMGGAWRANAALAAIAYFSFGLFAVMVEHARTKEEEAKKDLACTNAELHATQALLIDGSRGAERLRIARELHDLLGHHLTALSLNLEVASHLANDEARPHVEKSQQLTRLLLGDVRAVVSELRQDGCFDLARALRTLTLEMPAPRVHLDLPEELCIDDPVRAHILLRGAQEILTNAARHSGAENLWLGLLRSADGIALTARDDGRGSPGVKPGNGLNGIRERVEAAGGALKIDGASGGFKLEVWLPLEGSPA